MGLDGWSSPPGVWGAGVSYFREGVRVTRIPHPWATPVTPATPMDTTTTTTELSVFKSSPFFELKCIYVKKNFT